MQVLTTRQGAFGVVSLVKERATGNLYAMKQVSVFCTLHASSFCALPLVYRILRMAPTLRQFLAACPPCFASPFSTYITSLVPRHIFANFVGGS